MPKLPLNKSKKVSDQMYSANSSAREIQKLSRDAVKRKGATGDTTGCREIKTPDGKTTFYVKPNQDTSGRLKHYQLRYPDAKIVK